MYIKEQDVFCQATMICSNSIFLAVQPWVVEDSVSRKMVFETIVDMFLLNHERRAQILNEGKIPTVYHETPGIVNGVVYTLDPEGDFPDLFRTLKRRGPPTEIGLDELTQEKRWVEMFALFKLMKKAAIEANPVGMDQI